MLISEQTDIVRAMLAAAGLGEATEFHIDGGNLLVDGVPHTLEAKPLKAEEEEPAKAAPAKKAAKKK